jgi:hypothetical protein
MTSRVFLSVLVAVVFAALLFAPLTCSGGASGGATQCADSDASPNFQTSAGSACGYSVFYGCESVVGIPSDGRRASVALGAAAAIGLLVGVTWGFRRRGFQAT